MSEHLTKRAGVESFASHTLATFPEMDKMELRRLRNQYWNAFKHATTRDGLDREDEALFERFCDEDNEAALIIGWYDYHLAIGVLPVEAQAFQAWYFSLYPEKLGPEVDTTPYEELFPGLKIMSHSKRKDALRKVIAVARGDNTVMNDPRTDARPLVLPREAIMNA